MDTLICTKCKLEKPVSEMHKDSKRKTGYRSTCKACDKLVRDKRTKENPEKYRKDNRERTKLYNLKNVYNITLEDYNRMLQEQNGVCKVCGKIEVIANQFGPRSLCVDHDHDTGQIRGLLCNRCNRVLGMVKDDKELLQKLSLYLG